MKKFVKTIIAVMAVVVMGVSLTSCGSGQPDQNQVDNVNTQDDNSQQNDNTDGKEKIVMATNAEFPPYEYKESQTIKGIDVEIAQAIAESMGKELAIEDMAFDSIIPAIASGKADMGLAGMTIKEDRLLNADFSETYCHASQVIIVRSDETEITDSTKLAGKTLGVQLGTTGDYYATDDVENSTVERYAKAVEGVQALISNKVDAVIIDDEVAKAMAVNNSDIKILDEPCTEEDYAIAVKKGNTELLEQINSVLKDLKDSGELQNIIDKYKNENS